MYLHGIETKYNRIECNHDGDEHPNATISVFKTKVRIIGETRYTPMMREKHSAMHWFVLNNCPEIEVYLKEHEDKLKQENFIGWETRQKKEFASWFQDRIQGLRQIGSSEGSDELFALASCPDFHMTSCSGA
ncbi:hypothetical protein ACJIZ3_019716 [Penstemon smallii]|uniref:Uncharacterized protein n=1 Tax=Penstemon smallii TaxID=265156 RepID=A0ABD3T1Y4_9LAMI